MELFWFAMRSKMREPCGESGYGDGIPDIKGMPLDRDFVFHGVVWDIIQYTM